MTDQDLHHWMTLAGDLVGTHQDLQKQIDEPTEKMKMNSEANPQPKNQLGPNPQKRWPQTKKSRKQSIQLYPEAEENASTETDRGGKRKKNVIPETQQGTGNDTANGEENDEIPSFQQPRENEETIDWDSNFPVLQLTQDDGQDPTASGSTQAKTKKLKKKNIYNI